MPSAFATNVKNELERLHKSTYWLSKESGICQSLISNYLNGRVDPSLQKALAIAGALHIPLSQLTEEISYKQRLLADSHSAAKI